MLQSIFTVYDEKAEAHLPPFFMHNSQMAIRAFTDCIAAPEHKFAKHPSDYTLFLHGSFEDNDASFTLQAAPKVIGNGVEFITVPNNEQIPDARTQKVSHEPPLRFDPTG